MEMRMVVCVRQGRDGEINPFDASAYEAALQVRGAEITLVSMGPPSVKDFLLRLTRLGAKKAILLTDGAFAGADTLATAYTLSRAIGKLQPDLILCGRQTLEGDTAQTGPMLSAMAQCALITNVLEITKTEPNLVCQTREEGEQTAGYPALITVEKKHILRLPSIRSRAGEVEVWDAADIEADVTRCGLSGSPTRVLKTFENKSGKRKCRFIAKEELGMVVGQALKRAPDDRVGTGSETGGQLENVCIVGEKPGEFAETISHDITVLELSDEETLSRQICERKPNAVLWGSDTKSRRVAAQVAARLQLGLCADCTRLEVEDHELIMYRPALSGSLIAKIRSSTAPAMATVRTADNGVKDIVVAAGYGVKDELDKVKEFAAHMDAELAATRKLVDHGYLPYEMQVGLTGKTVSPPVYIAIGVSGAVHHIAGMQRAGTVIAINTDKNAPIFDYADYGIVL